MQKLLELGLLLLLVRVQLSTLDAYNISFVGEVLQRIGRTHNYTTAPVFVGRDVNSQTLSLLLKGLQTEIGTACYILTDEESSRTVDSLRNDVNIDALSIMFTRSSQETVWFRIDRRLRKLRSSKLVLVLPDDKRDTYSALQKIFERLWEKQFLNVVVLQRGQIYRYTPYPKLRHFLVTDARAELFPPQPHDLQGYVVSTPVENDLPRVFYIANRYTQQPTLHGYSYRVFTQFLQRHNATLHITNLDMIGKNGIRGDMHRIVRMVSDNKIEISLHPYEYADDFVGVLSYPLLKALNCLIVPVQNELPHYMYLLRPFQWRCYVLLFVALHYNAFMLYWLRPAKLGARVARAERYMHCVLESLTHLMFLPSMSHVSKPSWRYLAAVFQLAVLGFFVTLWYSNLLSSFLITFLVGEQVNTYEQLAAAQLPIMVQSFQHKKVLENVPPHLERRIERLILAVEGKEQAWNLYNLNTEYSYLLSSERWQFIALQQQYANKPVFRRSEICFGAPHIGLPMRLDSHLESFLEYFIMDIQASGLLDYWLVYDFQAAVEAGYLRLVDNAFPFRQLDLETLGLAWVIIVLGWLAATLAFVAELWQFKRNHS